MGRQSQRDAVAAPARRTPFSAVVRELLAPSTDAAGAARTLAQIAAQRRRRFAAMRLRRAAASDGLDEARAAAIERLPAALSGRLFLDPAFARLSAAPGTGGLELAGHSTTIPLAAAGLHPDGAFRLQADAAGRLLFSGHPVSVELGVSAAGRAFEARWANGALRVAERVVAAHELLEGPASARSHARRIEIADGIEFGSGTPFFGQAATATLGAAWRPAKSHAAGERRVRAALALLKTVWPAHHAQALAHMRSIAVCAAGGFEGSTRALLGALFFGSGPSWFREKVRPVRSRGERPGAAVWQDVEFIVHESAHQQLFALDELFPLWSDKEPGRLLRSPWTGRPRPAGVLGAGLHAYVMTWEALLRLREARALPPAQDLAVARRLGSLSAGFAAGFALARGALDLTPQGAFLLESLSRRTAELS